MKVDTWFSSELTLNGLVGKGVFGLILLISFGILGPGLPREWSIRKSLKYKILDNP